ncbi:MAG: hypothetical protein PHI74_07865, partial [Methanocellales archaeon]|nr:hypothetical protein [Methanocellales archaeon]MDD3292452.1 hypothetical protein [Methanocellales archaeon]MDD5485925.1 hypothetical protein [Methanocellales archaeon]
MKKMILVCTIALLCAMLVMPTASAADVIVWEYTGANNPSRAERLPDGNTLIADSGNDRVIEVAPDGTIVWEYTGGWPQAAHRLSNGNTLISDFDEDFYPFVKEVAPDGTIVWQYSTGLNNPIDADRLPDGNTLITDWGDEYPFVIEVAPNGTIVWEYSTGLFWPSEADRLPNGNTLISDTDNSRVIEVAPDGTIVWQYSGANAFDADRLPDGNTLIADVASPRFIEVAPDGTIVWEYITGELDFPISVERLSNGNTLLVDLYLNEAGLVFEVGTPIPADWNLTLTGELTDTINRTSFEEGAACHNASWNDGTNTWAGIPLWRLVGWVDDL